MSEVYDELAQLSADIRATLEWGAPDGVRSAAPREARAPRGGAHCPPCGPCSAYPRTDTKPSCSCSACACCAVGTCPGHTGTRGQSGGSNPRALSRMTAPVV